MNRTWTILAGLALCMFCAMDAQAQGDFVLWLTPEIGDFEFIGELGATYYGDADVERRSDDIQLMDYDLRLRAPLARDADSEWILGADVEVLETGGGPRIRGTFDDLPGALSDISVSASYRQFFNDDWLAVGNLSVGSASNRLFDSFDEVYIRGNAFLGIPHLEYTAWLFYLNVDTWREWPVLPGVGYQFPMGRRVLGVVGIPIIGFGGEFTNKLSAEAYYIPVENAHVRLTYAPTERLKTFVAFDWESKTWRRVEREDDDDELELEQKLIKLGGEFALTEAWSLEVNGGYAFDRSFAEDDDRSDREDEELEFDDSWFGGINLKLSF